MSELEQQQSKRIKELEAQVALLSQQLDYLKRQIFGRKSEKLAGHPELFELEPGKSPASSADEEGLEEAEEQGKAPLKRRRPIRANRIPGNLPVEQRVILPQEVLDAPDGFRLIGEDITDQMEIIPAYLYLERTIRPKFARVDNPWQAPLSAAVEPRIIEGGFWGPGLLAEILSNKYLYHLPFDRQHTLFKQRYGVDLPPSTMSDAAGKVAEQLKLIYARMKERMLEGDYIQADETPVRYLDPSHPGGSALGYLWTYRGLNGDVLFDWQTSREHHHVSNWLGGDFEGVLQSDGYDAYVQWCRAHLLRGKKIKRAACLAHIRRKFEQALEERPELAGWVLRIMAQLYRIETPLREHEVGAEIRARIRNNQSRYLIELLGKAFKHLINSPTIRPKSRMGQALQYALGQWPDMYTYLDEGRVEIDNNKVENSIRPSALGKRNWLFFGGPEAGERAAILYSLLISARNHGADPQAYLRDVIERLPGADPAHLDDLLPENWANAHRDEFPAVFSSKQNQTRLAA